MQLFVGTKAMIHYQGKILLLRESSKYLDGTEMGKWDVPGGRISPEETLDEGLFREVKEESGLDIVKGKLLGAFDGYPVIRGEKCHVIRLYFLCETKTDVVKLSGDHDAYDWIVPSELHNKVVVNDIAEMLAAVQQEI